MTAGEIAMRADAPRKFLEAILLELSRRHLVISRRGKFGGYLLARPPSDISFAEVIRAIDGPQGVAGFLRQHGSLEYGPTRPYARRDGAEGCDAVAATKAAGWNLGR